MITNARTALAEQIAVISKAQTRVDELVVPAVIERIREIAPATRTVLLDVDGPNEYFVTGLVDADGTEHPDPQDEELDELANNLRRQNLRYSNQTRRWDIDVPAL